MLSRKPTGLGTVHQLIEDCGRLNVPGRPILYRTTANFLRTFGISSLEDLPPIEKVSLSEPELPQETVDPDQMTIEEV